MGKTPRITPLRLSEKLRQVREQLALSQNELIRQMGFADVLVQASISGYESGTREPPLPVLLAYARAANVIVDVLIDDALDLPEKLPSKHKHSGVARDAASKQPRRITTKQKLSP